MLPPGPSHKRHGTSAANPRFAGSSCQMRAARPLAGGGRYRRSREGSFPGHLAELGDELALVGKLTRLQLRIDELAVDRELETTAAGWNQRQALYLLLVGSQDSVRQTDGLRLIASQRAIL